MKRRLFYLDVARSIAIISISLNHAVNRSYAIYSGQMQEFQKISSVESVFKSCIYILSRIGVPLFLMITGTLILRKSFEHETDIKKFYKDNWGRIIITTEIWMFFMYWGQCLMEFHFLGSHFSLKQLIFGCFLNALFINQKTFASMWYMQMIIPLYTVLPMFAVSIKKGLGKYLAIVSSILFFIAFVLPSFNSIAALLQINSSFNTTFVEPVAHLIIYIFAGYYLSNEDSILRKINNLWLNGMLCLMFVGCLALQLYGFSAIYDFYFGYESAFIFVLSCFIFEWVRRNANIGKRFKRTIEWISSISFAIYFVHIFIMEFVNISYSFAGWRRFLKLFALEGISVGGAIIFIYLFSKIKWVRDYMFLIK